MNSRETVAPAPSLPTHPRLALRLTRLQVQFLIRLAIVAAIVFCILAAPLFTSFNPLQQNISARLKPAGYVLSDGRVSLLGTDQLGRDIFSRILYGGQLSLFISVSGVILAAGIGIALGLVAGYYGGVPDRIISAITDIQLGFPGLLLAITLAAALGPGLANVIIALGIARWTTYERVVRGAVFSLRSEEFILAAQVIGCRNSRIMWRHILPNMLSSIIVIASLHLGQMILAESALAFIGLGVQPPTPTWGNMINKGREYITSAWWLIAYPGAAITLMVLALGLLGDTVRDILDPRMRSRVD